MTDAELQRIEEQFRDMDQRTRFNYLYRMDRAFETKVIMHLGDGIYPAEPDAYKNTIEIKYKGEQWYFFMIDGPTGVNLVKKSKYNNERNFDVDDVIAIDMDDREAPGAYYQLLTGTWIEPIEQSN